MAPLWQKSDYWPNSGPEKNVLYSRVVTTLVQMTQMVRKILFSRVSWASLGLLCHLHVSRRYHIFSGITKVGSLLYIYFSLVLLCATRYFVKLLRMIKCFYHLNS